MENFNLTQSKQELLNKFRSLENERKQLGASVKTRQQELEHEEKKKLVELASAYTVENIVKGMTDIQLDFNKNIELLNNKLNNEIIKLSNLQQAITIESQRLKELEDIFVAAEVINIITTEHELNMTKIEQDAQKQKQQLENVREITEKQWQKEQKEFETEINENKARKKQERKKNEADFQYDLERKRKVEKDKLLEEKRILERKLSDENEQRENDWKKRAQKLESQKDLLEVNKKQVEKLKQDLDEAVNKARQNMINEISANIKVEKELFDKQIEADKQAYELEIKSLEDIVNNQAKQIEKLATQLQNSLEQVQNLTMKTIESSKKEKVKSV